MNKILFNLQAALDAVAGNWLRSTLTALGIIFGVGAVIAMLAVGNGAKQEILDQIALVGVNNIVVQPILPESGEDEGSQEDGNKIKKKFTGGLNLEDAQSIADVIPGINKVSPEIVYPTYAIRNAKRKSTRLVGVTPAFFDVYNIQLEEGRVFNKQQLSAGDAVCIIGNGVKTQFFSSENPVNKKIKVGNIWLTVIGVMAPRAGGNETSGNLGIRDYNREVFVPVQTALLRYKNRSLITESALEVRSDDEDDEESQSQQSTAPLNFNQLDKVVVQVEEAELLNPVAETITRMLKRRHLGEEDFKVFVPELLLKQQQRTKNIFNIVLGSIAGISLLVGGIGIMNIMLASVWERIREIGVRQAVGATRKDVITQFLSEAVIISLGGGLIGIIFGVSAAKIITQLTGILTIITLPSVLVSFVVAAAVGLVFGIMPAKKAADQDPIESLRHE